MIESLQAIEDQVLQFPQAFSSCTGNTAGEIRARSRSLTFVVNKLF